VWFGGQLPGDNARRFDALSPTPLTWIEQATESMQTWRSLITFGPYIVSVPTSTL
jgi:hypothetical protein